MRAVIYSANNAHRDGRMTPVVPNSDNENLLERELEPNSAADAPVLTGYEVRGATPVNLSQQLGPNVEAEIAVGSTVVNTIWAWIEGLRMRLKIKKDLGRKATQADLTSIDTWMKVDEVERRKEPDKPSSLG
jgi:hypothetical protein